MFSVARIDPTDAVGPAVPQLLHAFEHGGVEDLVVAGLGKCSEVDTCDTGADRQALP